MIEMGVIAPLPGGVVSHLRSSTILADFEQAVEELVCNSLDAGATEVHFFSLFPNIYPYSCAYSFTGCINFSCRVLLIKTVD